MHSIEWVLVIGGREGVKSARMYFICSRLLVSCTQIGKYGVHPIMKKAVECRREVVGICSTHSILEYSTTRCKC